MLNALTKPSDSDDWYRNDNYELWDSGFSAIPYSPETRNQNPKVLQWVCKKEFALMSGACGVQSWLFVTPWTGVHQAPLSMEFSRQEYWNGLPFPSPGDLLDQGSEPIFCVSCIGSWIQNIKYITMNKARIPRDRTWVSCIADKFFTVWATGEAQNKSYVMPYHSSLLITLPLNKKTCSK